MPKGRLVITVKGCFFGMMSVCRCVCGVCRGVSQPRLLMWGRMKAALRVQYTATRKSSSFTTFLCFSPIFPPPFFISLSHSPATLPLLSPLDCLSPPSVVSLSNFPYTSSPLFHWSLFPLPQLSSCLHSSVAALFSVLPLLLLSIRAWPLSFPHVSREGHCP